jgi:predicted TIM-barrel fold metal-dependent hydrolase
MTVIDVDSHWELARYPKGEHPLEPWRAELPRDLELLAFAIAGDLLEALPNSQRPTPQQLLPKIVEAAEQREGRAALHPEHESTAAERVAWMDRIGIDHCLVNPGGYWQQIPFTSDPPAATRNANSWLAERLHAHADRLHAVAVIDFSDLDTAVVELERTRALGARAFFLATRSGRPAGGTAPGHPAFDRIWSAATSLGMVAVIHVGNTSADFTGWADIGWEEPASAGIGGLIRLANTQRVHAAQNLVASMLFGGVFARHPTLTVVLEEMGVGWLPWFVRNIGRQSEPSIALGDWPFETSGSDMLRRNLRITPLPGFGDEDAIDVLEALPEMVVFSSDYPHQEGDAEPIARYGTRLDLIDPDTRARFMGENATEWFQRMHAPLSAV